MPERSVVERGERKGAEKITRLLVIFSLAACTGVSAVAAQSLDAVFERLQSGAVPASEILAAVRGAQNGSPKDDVLLAMMYREACLRADRQMLPALIETFEKLPPDAFARNETFPALASLWLQNEIPRTLKKRPEFPDVEVKLPPVPSGYPEELVTAMKRYVRVAEPFRKITETPISEGRYFQMEEKKYWELLGGMMTEKDGPVADKILDFYWGGGCGTGSEIFAVPHASAVAVALAHDRRWAEAAGASMSVIAGREIDGALRLLQACVPDPLEVITGGLVFLDLGSQSFWMEYRKVPLLNMLMRMSGDERVDRLIALTKAAPPEAKEQYFKALAKLASASGPGEAPGAGLYSSMMIFENGASLDGIEPRPVSAEAARRAEMFLRAQVPANLSIAASEALISILREKKWAGSEATLHRMLDHPSATVAKSAAEVMKEMGATVEIPPKLGPVRYRITVDGIPYASRQLQWALSMGETSMSSEVTTDDGGIASLSRDRFIDKTSQKILRVVLRSVNMAGPDDPWFSVVLDPPPETDDVIPVEVETKAMQVNLPAFRPAEELKGVRMEVVLRGVQAPEQQNIGYWAGAEFTLPVADEVTFAKIMPGNYEMVIRAPGAMVWQGKLPVGEEPEITVPLQRASDVKFILKVPDEKSFRPTPELRKDGEIFAAEWDYKNSRYRGVPEGKYVIHVASRAEIKAQYPQFPMEGPEFEGADVPFEVRADSPVEIDLGEIDLTPKKS